MPHFGASLTDDASNIIYNCNKFMIQASGFKPFEIQGYFRIEINNCFLKSKKRWAASRRRYGGVTAPLSMTSLRKIKKMGVYKMSYDRLKIGCLVHKLQKLFKFFN